MNSEGNMDESINYAEYTVTKKPEGTNLRNRILLIALYALVFIGICVLIGFIKGAAVWGGVIFVLLVALVFFTWRLVREERQAEVSNARLKLAHLNGSGKKKIVYDELVSAFTTIAPMTDEHRDAFTNADEIIDCRGNSKSPDSYFARLERDGKSTVVCFEATNKMLKVMKFYNRNTVVAEMRY